MKNQSLNCFLLFRVQWKTDFIILYIRELHDIQRIVMKQIWALAAKYAETAGREMEENKVDS